MFEVGFSEIAVIAVIALIVLGPERLPKAARMVGTFLRKARGSFESLKHEVERELEADELKKHFAQLAAAPAALANEMQQPFADARTVLEHSFDTVMQPDKEPRQNMRTSSSGLDDPPRDDVSAIARAQAQSEISETVVQTDESRPAP